MKIAVLVNENGNTIHSNEDGIVRVYSREGEESWELLKELPYDINELSSPGIIRKKVIELVEGLEGCKIFVALEVKGILFTYLDGNKFNIWKVNGVPEEFLDYIKEKEEEEIKISQELAKIEPASVGDDCYFIDLKTAIENNEKTTSKKILLPFLSKTKFKKLEIICEHVPKWFDKEFSSLNLSYDQVEDKDVFNVTVYPNEKK